MSNRILETYWPRLTDLPFTSICVYQIQLDMVSVGEILRHRIYNLKYVCTS